MARARRGEATVMSDARTAILGRIDRALRTARIPAVNGHVAGDPKRVALQESRAWVALQESGAWVALQESGADVGRLFQGRHDDRDVASDGVPDRVALRERFVAEGRALGVDTFVETTPEGVRDRLATIIAGLRVLSWNPDQLPYGAGALVAGAAFGSSPRADQAAAEVGVTGCHGAIAETGSMALLSGPGCSRAVSLLPPLHVALVRPDDLFYGMGDFFSVHGDRIAGTASCTFVTGPSRTADIELSLTIGVHGPARVVIIVGP